MPATSELRSDAHTSRRVAPSMREATRVWAKIGVLSFGGPAAQIALMHRIVVDEKGWLSEQEFLNALSFCMLLPGPEAMQLATFAGWKLHGVRGGLIAGLLFVLPGAFVVLALAAIYALYGDLSVVEALFFGIKAAVIVVVAEALVRVSKRALSRVEHWLIAAFAFVGIFFIELPYPLIILGAGVYGFLRGSQTDSPTAAPINVLAMIPNTAAAVSLWLILWWLPVLGLHLATDFNILVEIGRFFSLLAVVTFGGAYAVLAYLAQDVVNQHGWLSAGEVMDGLGLAETTPGPLILVTEFVGFIAAYRDGGFGLGLAGAGVTLWVTFVPCFLWIFAGAPYIEWICAQPRLRGALSAITAAVVGVILNLSIWFGLHVFFGHVEQRSYGTFKVWQPEWLTLDWRVIVLSILCGVLVFRLHWNILWVLLLASGLGLAIAGPSLL